MMEALNTYRGLFLGLYAVTVQQISVLLRKLKKEYLLGFLFLHKWAMQNIKFLLFGKSSQVEHKAGHSEPPIESSLLAGSPAGKCKCLSFTPQKKPPVFHAIFCLSHSTWTDWGTHQALPEAEQLVMPLSHTVCHLLGIQTDTHRQALGHRHISLLKPIT